MTDYGPKPRRKHLARLSECPKCRAPAGELCTRPNGQVRFAYHRERHGVKRIRPRSNVTPYPMRALEFSMSELESHPLVRGDIKRMHALTLLRSTSPWPSSRDLARVIGWSKTTAAEFINAVRLFDSGVSGQSGEVSGQGSSGGLQSDGCPDSGRTDIGKKNNGDERVSGQSGRRLAGQPPNSQMLPHPINKLPLSDYDSEPSSLRSLEPESSSGALRRAEQPRLDFNHAEERRADLLKALIFDHGVRLLTSTGMPDDSARSFLGKRIAELGREPLAKAITTAIIDQVVEPRAYLAAVSPRAAEPARAASAAPAEPADYFEPWWNDPLPAEPLPGMPGYDAWCAEVAESERKRIDQEGGNGPH